jgi:hypothetical protein
MRMDVKSNAEDTVESLIDRIERRKLLPCEKMQEHFIALGLCGEGQTVAQIRAQNLVSKEDCIRLFSNPISCTQFKYGDCKDPKLKAKIARIWPLIYMKTCVAKRLLYKFTRAIIADTCTDWVHVNWADFAVERTLEFQSKYKVVVGRLVRRRSKIVGTERRGFSMRFKNHTIRISLQRWQHRICYSR